MLSVEKKFIDWIDRNKIWLFAIVVSLFGAAMRWSGSATKSNDFISFLEPWFNAIKQNGGLSGVSQQVGNYNVLYQLLIALLTYIPLPPLYLYKGLSVVFDYLLAIAAARLVYFCSDKDKIRAVFAYAVILCLPSIFINSAFWAQCDSMYCFFLLLCFTAILQKRHLAAAIYFAIAFQFKLQSVFFLPFLVFYYFRTKECSLLHLMITPLMSIVICLLCGRSPFDTFAVYFGQTSTYEKLMINFPNIWNLISNEYDKFQYPAIMLTFTVLGMGLLWVLEKKTIFDRQTLWNLCIWSVWTCVLILPGMHDRYGYFVVVMLALASVLNPRMSGYLVMMEIVTCMCYAAFLFPTWTMARQVPAWLYSMIYLAGYMIFCYQMWGSKKRWLPNEAALTA